ncbi:hypothetical protein HHK36_016427 [Tetracentron sinense]|uniref:RING-type E3 ubiquitin transferase n=1 Tax=Tetracentron sinense TaxID=13715 RepID=A0A834Z0Q4_TETSI|nr:hypothetical protein HHK36_016427 [Tetracentron sinense]
MADQRNQRLEFSPLFIGLLGIMLAAIIIMIYHCIAAGWCSRRLTLSRSQRRRGLPSEQEERPSSLENSMAQLMPAYKYTKEGQLLGEGEEPLCAVCLCEFKDGDEVRILPECIHSFHVPCIDMWLFSHSNCPLCRTDTTPPQHPVQSLPDSGGLPPPEVHRLPDFGG